MDLFTSFLTFDTSNYNYKYNVLSFKDFICAPCIYVNVTGPDFLGGARGGGGGGMRNHRNDLHPPPKAFGTPANYIYFDLIVSYSIILTTKFVKLPILWSQISPCRLRKQILLNFFLGLSGHCQHALAKASSSTPPDIYPPP